MEMEMVQNKLQRQIYFKATLTGVYATEGARGGSKDLLASGKPGLPRSAFFNFSPLSS